MAFNIYRRVAFGANALHYSLPRDDNLISRAHLGGERLPRC